MKHFAIDYYFVGDLVQSSELHVVHVSVGDQLVDALIKSLSWPCLFPWVTRFMLFLAHHLEGAYLNIFRVSFYWPYAFCETPKKSRFLRKCRTVKFGQNPKFFYISDDKTDFTVGIVSRNLATTSNFVKFRDSRNFTFFKASRMTRGMWQVLSGSRRDTCQDVRNSNNELKYGL